MPLRRASIRREGPCPAAHDRSLLFLQRPATRSISLPSVRPGARCDARAAAMSGTRPQEADAAGGIRLRRAAGIAGPPARMGGLGRSRALHHCRPRRPRARAQCDRHQLAGHGQHLRCRRPADPGPASAGPAHRRRAVRERVQEGDRTILLVRGLVENTTDKGRRLPPLRAVLADEAGSALHEWPVAALARDLDGGRSTPSRAGSKTRRREQRKFRSASSPTDEG